MRRNIMSNRLRISIDFGRIFPAFEGKFENVKLAKHEALVRDISQDWSARIHEIGDNNPRAWYTYSGHDGFYAPVEFYCIIFNLDIQKAEINFTDPLAHACNPAINVQELDNGWLIITWNYKNEYGLPAQERDPGETGYLFAYKGQQDETYRYVPIPDICRVNHITGDITIHFEGRDLVFKKNEDNKLLKQMNLWPWVLRAPDKWFCLGLIARMLTAKTENPLSMLIRSNDPMIEGIGQQIAKELMLAGEKYPL